MQKFIIISGSRRENSFNTALAQNVVRVIRSSDCKDVDEENKDTASSATQKTHSVTKTSNIDVEFRSILQIPFYSEDVERKGFPQSVMQLAKDIDQSDGLIIITPEYNGFFSGNLLNTLDWLSRSISQKLVLREKPVAIMGVSPGEKSAIRALEQTKHLALNLKMRVYPETFGLGFASQVFDESYEIKDDKIKNKILSFVESFAVWI